MSEHVLVRVDPWSKRDAGTHKSVHETFRRAGFNVRSAAYNEKGEGRGHLPLKASTEMVNRLLRSASGKSRLFVEKRDGKCAAPNLMRAIELSEWNPWGEKEVGRKDDKSKDPTDHTSALRYALWAYERTRIGQLRKTEVAFV